MRMAVGAGPAPARSATGQLPVTQSALILGGGLAGMTSALAVADQGYPVTWSRRRPRSAATSATSTTRWSAATCRVPGALVQRVTVAPEDHMYLKRRPSQIAGHVGNFKSRHRTSAARKTTSATAWSSSRRAARSAKPTSYLHGKNPHVVTQRKLEELLAAGGLRGAGREAHDRHDPVRRVAQRRASVLQPRLLLGGREERPGDQAAAAGARVVVLAKDIRTYGFREDVLPEGPRGRRSLRPLPEEGPGGRPTRAA